MTASCPVCGASCSPTVISRTDGVAVAELICSAGHPFQVKWLEAA